MRYRFVIWICGCLAGLLLIGGLAAQRGYRSREPRGEELAYLPRNPDSEYAFARMIYDSETRPGRWRTDYPPADYHFMAGVKRLSLVDAHQGPVIMGLNDKRLFQYPFLYAVEVGYFYLSQQEADTLREFLARGGFFVVDDFHGTREWQNFETQIRKVYPNRPIVDLEMTHAIFQSVFNIKDKMQVPGAQYLRSGVTYEHDGYEAKHRAIFDDDGRVVVMINHNMDLGDAWEWADVPEYEERYTTRAYHLGIDYIVYSMSH